ncbi:ATP-binding protein [Petropleomorpha daqingensis]|uniref:Putative ATPase/DNA-binding SARP family transcriptional activator n=1 Tax=Petropleomorpha daqingensis TaxID=2026353 RepID=A0A853CHE5_9ACTN|nr:AAA family ATPase [Petropleomorpha daqingensis]NYJ07375.1 putative ATPase/DNA-binding SARP family transcriptional activator [Petropleomorpha daqingensis]
MDVTVRLLGGFAVAVDGRPVPDDAWRRRSATALVKLLALAPGHRVLREQVTDALWPDLLLDDALPRLHTAAHYARAALGGRDAVVLDQGAVALFPGARLGVDVEEFERAADAARDGGPEPASAAADLYAGDLLPDDPYEPWAELPREHLRRRWLEVLRTAGRFEELVAADPLDEQAQLALARQHLAHGRWQAAVRSLDRMAEVFRAELGAEPGPAAAALRREAARAAGGRRTRLPPARSRLIGRDDDVAAVESLLRTSRVVTVTGPGGAGKSTLALAVARRYQPDGEADVLLAELAPVRDRAGLVRVVAEAAGVQGEGAVAPARLAALLGTRPVLLLLDNCEHLLDATAELLDAVLDAGPRVRILLTSREPLRIDGEVVHALGPLGAEAAELFVERATAAAGPGVAARGDPRVAELCRRLDGLPLAIELAAAQLVHLDLDELVARLDDRLTLLGGARPRAGVRHSALRATVEWSHQLLAADSRDLFARLGVFPAGFDLPAVQAVSGDAGSVPRLLGDLVAKSFVVHDPVRRRYRLLETLRLFAAQQLDDAGLRDETTERLRAFAVARARELPRARRWLSAGTAARSRDDLDTVRLAFSASLAAGDPTAAVDLALGLATLWRNAVGYAEGRRWVDALLAGDLTPCDRLWALVVDADVALGGGDPRRMAAAGQAAELAPAAADPAGAAVAAHYDAICRLSRPAEALARLDVARARAVEAGEPGLARLADAYGLVAHLLLGDGGVGGSALLADGGADYDSYIAIWATWLAALVDRDGPRLQALMDRQLAQLRASGLDENWLTTFSSSLVLVASAEPYLPRLRLARQRAEQEGRAAEADVVLALGYAAACRDDWTRAAELIAAAGGALFSDTAGFVHHVLIRDRLVRPRLGRDEFAAATARGEALALPTVLAEHGV